jgi:hypothetical protein
LRLPGLLAAGLLLALGAAFFFAVMVDFLMIFYDLSIFGILRIVKIKSALRGFYYLLLSLSWSLCFALWS